MIARQPYPADPPIANKSAERSVLVVDSDPAVRWSLEDGLSRSGYHVTVADLPNRAIELSGNNGISAIVMEIAPEYGFTVDVLSRVASSCHSPVIVCSSNNTSPDVVMDCVRRGASGFMLRPFDLNTVRMELFRARATAQGIATQRPSTVGDIDQGPSLLVGVSPAMQELRAIARRVSRVADGNLNCLLRGESGVGKDVVAREIHRLSPRRDKPFVKVNCGALPESLLESELFGYEEGAFTGASASKPGRFSLADGGTIFLDEICDMPQSTQAKLLQVTEHKEFTRLGGRTPVEVDVQIIAASNAAFEERLQTGAFRQDLYFRINEICINVPPLATRKEDIPALSQHFVRKHTANNPDPPPELSDKDMAVLCAWDWPGNVRELESTIKRWLALGEIQVGFANHVAAANNRVPETRRRRPGTSENEPNLTRIVRVLDECHWNRTKAAKILGLTYGTLRRRIAHHNLAQFSRSPSAG